MTSSEPIDPTSTEHRIDMDVDSTGFDRPPCPVYVRFFQENDRWQVIALTPPGRATEVARWMEHHGPERVDKGEGIAPKVVRGTFERLPGPWNELVHMANVRFIELRPQGAVSIFLDDRPERVRDLQERIESDEVRIRRSLGGREHASLTPRQLEVLSLAVALGYYELPHRVHQRTIAERLGMSVGSTSEILRRGEAQIIKSYIDGMVGSKWNDQEQDVLDLVRKRADAKEAENDRLALPRSRLDAPQPPVPRPGTPERRMERPVQKVSPAGDAAHTNDVREAVARLRNARKRQNDVGDTWN